MDKYNDPHKVTRYVHFLGRDHYLGSIPPKKDMSFVEEMELINKIIINELDPKQLVIDVLSIIHRSSNQKELCKHLFIGSTLWKKIQGASPRKRGILITNFIERASKF